MLRSGDCVARLIVQTVLLFPFCSVRHSHQSLTDEMLVELKSCFMEAYDDNQDGKIDIREVSSER